MTFFASFTFLSVLITTSLCQTSTVRRIGPSAVPIDQQTWGFQKDSRCRIFSHQATVLKNKDHHVLAFDGGIAKFKYRLNNEPVEVLDLNGFTGWIDLSKPFIASDFPLETHKRSTQELAVPVLSRFGIWSDSSQDCIFINGGHFYDADKWNSSQYFVPKSQLPSYNVWKFCLASKSWTKVYEDNITNRTLGGSFVSIPSTDMSYYFGGLKAPRAAKDNPLDKSISSNNLLTYNHKTNNINSFPSTSDGYGYWHGSMKHLPIGGGKGFLISLLAERSKLDTYIVDLPYTSDEKGDEVLFTSLLIYNLDSKEWYNQSTSFINEKVESRTRFCMELVYGAKYNTWDLWVFGGQRLLDDTVSTDEIWILSMPSFIWTKIAVPTIGTGINTRSPTCNAVGSQLLIYGGYPPGQVVAENATCDFDYLKIFDMSDPGWKSSYRPNTQYETPDQVVQRAELSSAARRKPYANPWSNPALQAAFDMPYNVTNTTKSETNAKSNKLSGGAIAGIAVGSVFAVILIVGLILFCLRERIISRLRRRRNRDQDSQIATGQYPRPTNNTPISPPSSRASSSFIRVFRPQRSVLSDSSNAIMEETGYDQRDDDRPRR